MQSEAHSSQAAHYEVSAGLQFGRFAKTGAVAVARVMYIVALLALGLIGVIGAYSVFTWSFFPLNLASSISFLKDAPTAVVGLVAACVAVDTLRQKQNADNRSALLARIQWAMELTTDDDSNVRDLGWRLLAGLVESPELSTEDAVLVENMRKYMRAVNPSPHSSQSDENEIPRQDIL